MGNSTLADNWGELLTANDIWEVMLNGGLQNTFLGFWPWAIVIATTLWALWVGWKLQAKLVGLKAAILPWLAALPTAFIVGYLPLWALHAFLWNTFAFLSTLGIPSLGWINLAADPLLHMAFGSALLLQWWLCRLDLACSFPKSRREWLIHFKDSFLRLWTYPVQWGNIVFFGIVIRTGLVFCVLCLAWGWGGQELHQLWLFYSLQVTVAAINAWIIGWALRVAALYWKNDLEVRSEVRALESVMRRKG
jgi:hypothetical protein